MPTSISCGGSIFGGLHTGAPKAVRYWGSKIMGIVHGHISVWLVKANINRFFNYNNFQNIFLNKVKPFLRFSLSLLINSFIRNKLLIIIWGGGGICFNASLLPAYLSAQP